MTNPYCSYRLRFHPDPSREQLRDMIADLVMLLHSNGVWPGVLYPAGSSKKQAMKRAFDLTRRDVIAQLRRTTEIPFVVFALSRETAGEIIQASTGDGVRLDAQLDTGAVVALSRLAERD